MPGRKLPEGEEFEQEKLFYSLAPFEEITSRAKELKFKSTDSYIRRMEANGARRDADAPTLYSRPRTTPRVTTSAAINVIEALIDRRLSSLPQPRVRAPTALRSEADEEVQVLLLSDLHPGLRTPSYNVSIFKDRLDVLRQKTIRLCKMHRKIRPIRKLAIFFLGDLAEGERVGQQVSLEELEITVIHQIFDVCAPALADFLVSMAANYDEVDCYFVYGNHGNLGKMFATTTNLDTIIGKVLEYKLAGHNSIHFNVESERFYQTVDVNNWRFLLFHGDQIPSHLGIPFYGIDRRTLRWSISIKENWDIGCCGHFHSSNYLEPSGIPLFMNGTFVTDDPYALQKMGLGSSCSQWTFFVSQEWGVTASYLIYLAAQPRLNYQIPLGETD